MTLSSSCASYVATDRSTLRVAVTGFDSLSGIFELSSSEPARNGLPHWVKQNAGYLGVELIHLYYRSSQWVVAAAARGQPERAIMTTNAGALNDITTVSLMYYEDASHRSRVTDFSATPACPPSMYGSSSECWACGAYEFAPPGSIHSFDCKCAPGAGRVGSTCAPCTGDTFRASTAANAPCNACPRGTLALDGAQAPAACHVPQCSYITV